MIEKEKSDCTFETIVVPEYPALGEAAAEHMKEVGVVCVILSQEETLRLSDCTDVQMQIRVKLTNGNATKSKVIHAFTDELLKDGVI